MRRFVRFASTGFALFSAMFWLTAVSIFGIAQITGVGVGRADMNLAAWAQAAPVLVYGAICVWFCHWFARGVAKRLPAGTFD
jgi:hypothetical protein